VYVCQFLSHITAFFHLGVISFGNFWTTVYLVLLDVFYELCGIIYVVDSHSAHTSVFHFASLFCTPLRHDIALLC